jgi:hypothetical protein
MQASGSATIVQLCVIDHGDQVTPHLHVKTHFADRTQGEWIILNNVDLEELKAAARVVVRPAASAPLRFHMHGPPARQPVVPAFLEQLWSCSLELSAAEAAALQQQGHAECPICLVDMGAGDEVVCLPCDGGHAAHRACMQPWLAKACTCPTCRFELPKDDSKQPFAPLIAKSKAAAERIKQAACEVAAAELECEPCDAVHGVKSQPRLAK